MDDYVKNGGPEEVWLLWNFTTSLCALELKKCQKGRYFKSYGFEITYTGSEKLFEADLWK